MGIVGAWIIKALSLLGDAYNTGDTLVRGIGQVISKAFGG